MSTASARSRKSIWINGFIVGSITVGVIALAVNVHGTPTMPPANPPANQLVGYTTPPSTTPEEVGTECVVKNRYIDKDVVLRPIAGCDD